VVHHHSMKILDIVNGFCQNSHFTDSFSSLKNENIGSQIDCGVSILR
jgi:hypothetical protein